jgi:hypothetical protein
MHPVRRQQKQFAQNAEDPLAATLPNGAATAAPLTRRDRAKWTYDASVKGDDAAAAFEQIRPKVSVGQAQGGMPESPAQGVILFSAPHSLFPYFCLRPAMAYS